MSHLDLSRVFARAFRRAGLGLKYSQGFNPKPLLAFTPALALGAEGLEEAVDFQIGAPMTEAEVVSRLSAALPEGIVVWRVEPAPAGAAAPSAGVAAAHYRVSVPSLLRRARLTPGRGSGSVESMPFNEESGLRSDEEAGDVDGDGHGGSRAAAGGGNGNGAATPPSSDAAGPLVADAAFHAERVREFNAAGSRLIEKLRKGRPVPVDLKKYAREVSLDHVSEASGATLRFAVAFDNGATVRPEEVLIGIYGFVPAGCSIVRERLAYG
jgi:hypothetical protein